MKKCVGLLCAAAITLLSGACTIQDADPFTATEDTGIQVSSIALSSHAISLTGSRGKTTGTLTATVTPSFALDTTILWSSSDESVATVAASATDSTTATVTLAGSGNAVITAQSSTGSASAQCSVRCEMESTPPLAVSAVSATPNGSNLFLSWTDPADYDSDLAYIQVSVAAAADSTQKAAVEVPAGLQHVWITGLSPQTGYVCTLTSYDESGNASTSVTTGTVTTNSEVDTTAPDAATAFSVTEKAGNTVTFGWTASADAVYQKLVLTATDGSALPSAAAYADGSAVFCESENASAVFLIKDGTTEAVTLQGCVAGASYTAALYELNADLVESEAVSSTLFVPPVVTDVKVSPAGSLKLTVTWTDFANDSYSYKVVLNGETVTASHGVQKATFTGLTSDTAYTATVYTMNGSEELASVQASGTALTIWHLLSGYSSGRYLARATSDSYTVGAITSGAGGDEYWIVHEALSGNEDYFSLEACGSDFTPTGYYMFLDTTGRAQDTGTNLWTSNVGYDYKLQVATLSEGLITAGRKDACFKKGASTVKTDSGWYRFYDENLGYYLCHASLAFGGVASSTTEDSAGCAAIYIEEVE